MSTGKLAKLKNKLKKIFNSKPDGRIFLNEIVRKEMNFKDNIPYIYRDMGVDKEFLKLPLSEKKYDILYSGSFKNRHGLLKIIKEIANKNLKIALIGDISKRQQFELTNHKNVKIFGVVPRKSIYKIYSESKIGLNFYPNIYPFNIQTSTKVLEYIASGMGILTNSYLWINDFEKNSNSKFLYYESTLTKDKILNFNYINSQIDHYEWCHYLNTIKFNEFIEKIFVNENRK